MLNSNLNFIRNYGLISNGPPRPHAFVCLPLQSHPFIFVINGLWGLFLKLNNSCILYTAGGAVNTYTNLFGPFDFTYILTLLLSISTALFTVSLFFMFRIRPMLRNTYGDEYLIYMFAPYISLNSGFYKLNSVMYGAMPVFGVLTMLNYLELCDNQTAEFLEEHHSAVHILDDQQAKILRLEKLIDTTKKLNVVITDIFRQGNALACHNLKGPEPYGTSEHQVSAQILNSPTLAELRSKHLSMVEQIRDIHGTSVRADNSYVISKKYDANNDTHYVAELLTRKSQVCNFDPGFAKWQYKYSEQVTPRIEGGIQLRPLSYFHNSLD